MTPRSFWVDEALDKKFPLAEERVQRRFIPSWRAQYRDQYHNVYLVSPGIYARLDEDGWDGAGLYVFRAGDWALRRAAYVDTARVGWSHRLTLLLRDTSQSARRNPQPSSRPPAAPLKRLFARRVQECEKALGTHLPLTCDVGPYPHFGTKRGFGVTFHDHNNPEWDRCHIRLAAKLEKAPRHRQDGIIRHELGHVLDLTFPAAQLDRWCKKRGVRLPPQKHGEIRADAIAHAVWGEPLKYDKDTVQSTKSGDWPRPAYLGL